MRIVNIQITKNDAEYQARIDYDNYDVAIARGPVYLSILKQVSDIIKTEIKVEKEISNEAN